MKYLASMIFFFAFALIGCEKLGIGPKEPKEPVPTVDFTYIEDQVGNVSFASSTTGKVDSYQWIIGKYTNNQPNPANSAWFGNNGTYNVTLKVIGPGGKQPRPRASWYLTSEEMLFSIHPMPRHPSRTFAR